METPQSGTSQTPSSSGIGGATVSLTPTSHTSTTELPSLQTLLGEILVENIGKEQAFVDAALDSFKEEDVSNVSLLITLYDENSKPTAGQEPFPKAFTDHMRTYDDAAHVHTSRWGLPFIRYNWICFVKIGSVL